ncbi:unnamed protein product [Vitrella brassicaformis CCMP3155]|uniref:Uncharacterized protein n=1 Tax=Vitrella brassicaformis (strain CCMP3155) TaxID=1169540 RepID=A0A0G4GLY2_VITBC|nr:unnamed protein product [Vitrella brassicaformis CCMP3155]|eukprot:CEM31143.1 unnamed protein product [Vitrella brassicaformis CCMP3155]
MDRPSAGHSRFAQLHGHRDGDGPGADQHAGESGQSQQGDSGIRYSMDEDMNTQNESQGEAPEYTMPHDAAGKASSQAEGPLSAEEESVRSDESEVKKPLEEIFKLDPGHALIANLGLVRGKGDKKLEDVSGPGLGGKTEADLKNTTGHRPSWEIEAELQKTTGHLPGGNLEEGERIPIDKRGGGGEKDVEGTQGHAPAHGFQSDRESAPEDVSEHGLTLSESEGEKVLESEEEAVARENVLTRTEGHKPAPLATVTSGEETEAGETEKELQETRGHGVPSEKEQVTGLGPSKKPEADLNKTTGHRPSWETEAALQKTTGHLPRAAKKMGEEAVSGESAVESVDKESVQERPETESETQRKESLSDRGKTSEEVTGAYQPEPGVTSAEETRKAEWKDEEYIPRSRKDQGDQGVSGTERGTLETGTSDVGQTAISEDVDQTVTETDESTREKLEDERLNGQVSDEGAGPAMEEPGAHEPEPGVTRAEERRKAKWEDEEYIPGLSKGEGEVAAEEEEEMIQPVSEEETAEEHPTHPPKKEEEVKEKVKPIPRQKPHPPTGAPGAAEERKLPGSPPNARPCSGKPWVDGIGPPGPARSLSGIRR